MSSPNQPSCVHEHDAPNVRVESEYSMIGHLMLITGISARPKLVRFRCTECKKVFDETSDPAVCGKYVSA